MTRLAAYFQEESAGRAGCARFLGAARSDPRTPPSCVLPVRFSFSRPPALPVLLLPGAGSDRSLLLAGGDVGDEGLEARAVEGLLEDRAAGRARAFVDFVVTHAVA